VQEAKSHIERLTEGRLADVVYDVTGFPAVFTHALGLARTFGKVVLLGDAGDPDQQHLSGELIRRGLQIVAAHDSNPPGTPSDHAWWTSRNMQKLFFNYIERGQMQVGDLITRRYKPQDAAAAYADLFRNRAEAMGTLFDWK
jgi:threonine dehydrogenase-like Zn-dependent dehydrogenase